MLSVQLDQPLYKMYMCVSVFVCTSARIDIIHLEEKSTLTNKLGVLFDINDAILNIFGYESLY